MANWRKLQCAQILCKGVQYPIQSDPKKYTEIQTVHGAFLPSRNDHEDLPLNEQKTDHLVLNKLHAQIKSSNHDSLGLIMYHGGNEAFKSRSASMSSTCLTESFDHLPESQ